MGQVFIADFSDLKQPEMTKVRPVIVISPRLPYRMEIVAIVPISTTPPIHNLPFCYKLSKNYHPNSPDDLPCWAKADMITNIAYRRLSGFKVGRRKWETPNLSQDDLDAVRKAVLYGLGFAKLLDGSEKP